MLLLAALIVFPAGHASAQKETKKKVKVIKKDDLDSKYTVWSDDDIEKEVKVIMEDGQRIVIVNGDTVEVNDCDPECEEPSFMMKRFDNPHHRMIWRSEDGPFGYLFGEFDDEDHMLFLPDLDIDIDIPRMDMWQFRDEEVRKLERKSRDLARDVRKAEGADKEQLEQELDDVLKEIFDRKQELRKERIEKLEERLEKSRQRYETRMSERERIIENRKNELLGEPDYLEW
jgi:hypothetical protein